MLRPPLEVADIFRLHGAEYRKTHPGLATVQYRAMRAIENCRTAALGGHVSDYSCGHSVNCYNSCRNRNCPKCQCSAAARWLEQRQQEILDVPYFHIVFTLPKQIAQIALGNQKVVYEILFRCVSQTLLQIAADKKYFGGQVGFLAILHTWGQNLEFHPHIHCVVPGGALTSDRCWRKSRKNFFLPVAVLSRLFRGKFLAHLRKAFRSGKLKFCGSLGYLSSFSAFKTFLAPLSSTNWVVYCKPPFGSPKQVLCYLGQYTHRIAISNHRLVSLENGIVSFRWKDSSDNSRIKILSLAVGEFIRRFLTHVVPSRFVRIRYYGFLSNRNRTQALQLIRGQLSGDSQSSKPVSLSATIPSDLENVCPICKKGELILVTRLSPSIRFDSS